VAMGFLDAAVDELPVEGLHNDRPYDRPGTVPGDSGTGAPR
jgi:hypothetical protein